MCIYVGWEVCGFYGARPNIRGFTFCFGFTTDNGVTGEAV